jgi:DNA-binding LacI/PurR family transcriptional regulator
MGRVTLQTIAEHVGVSRMTVSNAFSRPDQLSADLRKRILAAADELGYCGPDPVARGLSRGRTGTLGVLFTDALTYAFRDRVATEFLAGVASVAEPHGRGLTILASPRGGGAGPVSSAVMDGLVIYSVDLDSPGLQAARRRDIPIVLVDQEPDSSTASVNVDDRGGARAAAEHIVALGHRHVALLVEALAASPSVVPTTQVAPHHVIRERVAGWLEGLDGDGVASPTLVSVPGNYASDARAGAELLLDLSPRPTALLALSDVLARGVADVAQERGLQVPQDLSVVGFDDAHEYALVPPALTSVRQPVHDKGRIAAELLLSLLGDTETAESPHTLLPVELVVRDSTGPAPGGSGTTQKRKKRSR